MKINLHPNYNMYKNRVPDSASSATGGSASVSAARKDRNSIVRGSTTVGDRQLLTLKSGVHDYVSAPAGTKHLEEIRDRVLSGTYHIPTGDIVSAIMLDE